MYVCSFTKILLTGHKSSIHTHLNYLVIISPPFFPSATSASATVRNLVARQPSATETDVTKVTVFDAENKLVAYSGTFKQGVREVFSQWGMVYVLSTDGKVGLLVCLISLRLISCNVARMPAREIDGS